MIVGLGDKPSLEELAHFGVLGMKWGVHKTPAQERSARINKLQRRLDNMDDNYVTDAFQGYGLRGGVALRRSKKAQKKDPNYKYSKLSPAEKEKFNKENIRKARNSVLLRGIPQVALLVAGGGLAVSKLATSPTAIRQGQVGVAALGIMGTRLMLTDITAINRSVKLDDTKRELEELRSKKVGS